MTEKKEETGAELSGYCKSRQAELIGEINNLSQQVTIQSANLEAMKNRLNMLLGAKAEIEDVITKFNKDK